MSSVESLKKKKKNSRLPGDVIGQLEDKLKLDELNISNWIELINKIEEKDKTEQVRSTYDKFLNIFPFYSNQWINYVNYESNRGEFKKVEEIFKRCLQSVPSVGLWKTYINYIRRKNDIITGGAEARGIIIKAYDVAIEKVGIDPESSSLWEEYLNFIDEWKPITAWEEQQKMDLKRKIYKKALIQPLDNLEKLWSDYTSFENDLNTTTARKFISELSGNYMNARSWFKEWSNLIIKKNLIRQDGYILKDNELDEQLKLWRYWINLEKQNILELDEKLVINRINYVYKQAIQYLMFKSEIWFDYQQFFKDNEENFSQNDIEKLLHESILVNPISFSLNFKLIEIYEFDKNIDLVKSTFNKLIENLKIKYDFKQEEIDEIKQELIYKVLEHKKSLLINNNNNNNDDAEEEELKPLTEEEIKLIYNSNDELKLKEIELKKLSKIVTLTYCQYLKSIHHLQGLKEARNIFKECRNNFKDKHTHHIIIEAAYLEHSFDKNGKFVLNTFNLGLRSNFFPNDGEYIYKYLKFLLTTNDDTNANSLFETTVNTKKDLIESKWLKLIFKLYLRYQSKFGQLSSIFKIEKQYNEIFPNDDKILNFADRYSFNDILIDEFDIEQDLIRFNDLKETNVEISSLNIINKKRKLDQFEQDEFENEQNDNKKQHLEVNEDDFKDELHSGEVITGGKELVTDEIYNLLRVLPSAANFQEPIFNNSKLIKLLKEISA